MKVVFLDFDGVLNSSAYLSAEARKVDPPDWPVGEAGAIDPENVSRLNRLVRETGAAVVISSSWRHGRTRASLLELLRSRGFQGTVIGVTPQCVPNEDPLSGRQCGERGDEIQASLDLAPDYGYDVESFVILDDNSDMAHLHDRLVQTDTLEGLTEGHVELAILRLMGPRQAVIIPTDEDVRRFR